MDITDPSCVFAVAAQLAARVQTRLDALLALTLGDIWHAVYHPPNTPFRRAIVAIVLVAQIPRIWAWWSNYVASRRVVQFDWPAPEQASPTWKGHIITAPSLSAHERDPCLLHEDCIGGPARDPHARRLSESPDASQQYITCYDPATGAHLETMALRPKESVADQVALADGAQRVWAKTTFAQRASVLRSIKAWILRDMDTIVNVACRDSGKTRVDAVFGEIITTLAKIDWILKHGEAALRPSQRARPLLLMHKHSEVRYEPLGTVLACVSWNYPFHNALGPILAALWAGDAIVVKCSEQVAWSSQWFVGAVKTCIKACGWDDDVVQLVVCLPDVADSLTRNPTLKHITFIGSEVVGRKVAQAAAEIMVPTCIELGGKDPAFILPGADLEFFASSWMRGAFQAAGQNCCGIELFMIPRSMQARFLNIMAPRVRALRPGIDVGALISHTPIGRLERIVADAKAAGADVLVGGAAYIHPDHPEGAYFQPTLVADVTLDMEIAREELFAPVMTVVPYDDVDEALDALRSSKFGLGGSVFGNNKRECLRVADQLQCGMVATNDFGVFYLNQDMPFGGIKASGHGRFAGPEGLRGLCYPKSVVTDRWFRWIRTTIPKPVDFPLPAGERPWTFLHGLVNFAFGRGLGRVKGLVDVVRAA